MDSNTACISMKMKTPVPVVCGQATVEGQTPRFTSLCSTNLGVSPTITTVPIACAQATVEGQTPRFASLCSANRGVSPIVTTVPIVCGQATVEGQTSRFALLCSTNVGVSHTITTIFKLKRMLFALCCLLPCVWPIRIRLPSTRRWPACVREVKH